MLNTAILMGRLTADPELRHTPNDIPVITFTLAVERSYAKSGEQRQADFIDIVAWRYTAEFVSRYFQKGQLVAIRGSIQTRTYTDKEGKKRRQADFIDIVAWRYTAEFVSRYFQKGQLVAIRGSIQTRTYTDKEGKKRKAFEIIADQVHFAEGKRDTSPPSQGDNRNEEALNTGPDDFEEVPTDDDLPF